VETFWITNIEDNILSLLIHSADFIPFKSDHFQITFSINIQSSLLPKTSSYYMFNYSKGDYVGLCDHLTNIDFFPCLQSHDIEFIWSFIESTMLNAMNLLFQRSKSTIISNSIPLTSNVTSSVLKLCVASTSVIQLNTM